MLILFNNLLMNTEEFEKLFIEKIKPYEERIKLLEESEINKELEIKSLKNTIENMNKITIENMNNILEILKTKQLPLVAAKGKASILKK